MFQSFDWLAAFHLELLQAILFIAVQLSAAVFLATLFNLLAPEFGIQILAHPVSKI
jgi:hypothetical protein